MAAKTKTLVPDENPNRGREFMRRIREYERAHGTAWRKT